LTTKCPGVNGDDRGGVSASALMPAALEGDDDGSIPSRQA